MLEINKNQTDAQLVISLSGRLDTTTAPQLDETQKASLAGVTDLVLDFEKLEYVSSAGLRVLLSMQKTMNQQGKMKLIHVNSDIAEVFEITGFSDILTVE